MMYWRVEWIYEAFINKRLYLSINCGKKSYVLKNGALFRDELIYADHSYETGSIDDFLFKYGLFK